MGDGIPGRTPRFASTCPGVGRRMGSPPAAAPAASTAAPAVSTSAASARPGLGGDGRSHGRRRPRSSTWWPRWWASPLVGGSAPLTVRRGGSCSASPPTMYLLWVARASAVNLRGQLAAAPAASGTSTELRCPKLLFDVAGLSLIRQPAGPVRAASVQAARPPLRELAKEVPYDGKALRGGARPVSDGGPPRRRRARAASSEAPTSAPPSTSTASPWSNPIVPRRRTDPARSARRSLGPAQPGPCSTPPSRPTGCRGQTFYVYHPALAQPDDQVTITFFVEALRHAEPGEPLLLFGVGPTLHHVFLAAPAASEIHLAEYLPTNLQEIERWLMGEPARTTGALSSSTRWRARAWPDRRRSGPARRRHPPGQGSPRRSRDEGSAASIASAPGLRSPPYCNAVDHRRHLRR